MVHKLSQPCSLLLRCLLTSRSMTHSSSSRWPPAASQVFVQQLNMDGTHVHAPAQGFGCVTSFTPDGVCTR